MIYSKEHAVAICNQRVHTGAHTQAHTQLAISNMTQ